MNLICYTYEKVILAFFLVCKVVFHFSAQVQWGVSANFSALLLTGNDNLTNVVYSFGVELVF